MSLQKIAELAGTSKSTVSRVINNDPNVSEKTRARVQAIIEEQQFQVNSAARALASQHTKIIGVVMSNDIGVLFDTSFYFPTILRGISQATHERDYAMLLLIGNESEDDIRFARRIVHNQILDGLLLISPTIGHPLIGELINANIKFVSADRIEHPTADMNFCTVENIESSRQAVAHLIGLGRRRIAVLNGETNIIDTVDRIEGYKLALQDANIPCDPDLIYIDKFSVESGYRGVQYLLDNNIEFDAIYATQSTVAVGAVNALLDAGIRMPEDVSLISFDDLVEMMNPRIGISTMRQPVLEKGEQLVHILIDLIEGKATAPIQRYLNPTLIIRDTCGGISINSSSEQR